MHFLDVPPDGNIDQAKAAITQIEVPGKGVLFQATENGGEDLGIFSTVPEAAKAAEDAFPEHKVEESPTEATPAKPSSELLPADDTPFNLASTEEKVVPSAIERGNDAELVKAEQDRQVQIPGTERQGGPLASSKPIGALAKAAALPDDQAGPATPPEQPSAGELASPATNEEAREACLYLSPTRRPNRPARPQATNITSNFFSRESRRPAWTSSGQSAVCRRSTRNSPRSTRKLENKEIGTIAAAPTSTARPTISRLSVCSIKSV